jgi:hypothetical protein
MVERIIRGIKVIIIIYTPLSTNKKKQRKEEKEVKNV